MERNNIIHDKYQLIIKYNARFFTFFSKKIQVVKIGGNTLNITTNNASLDFHYAELCYVMLVREDFNKKKQ